MEVRTARQRREATAYHFEIQSHRLCFAVLERLRGYRYRLLDETRQEEVAALVLETTFDYYEYRLHRGNPRVQLLIVEHHNAVAPLRVLALDSGTEYAPGKAAMVERPDAKRRNSEEMRLLVSKLLLGLDSAKEELEKMPKRTRQRYLQRCAMYLKPRIGRPWAS